MNRDLILTKIAAILQANKLASKRVDIGRSTVIGIGDNVCFDVIDDGFMSLINPDELNQLQERPEAITLTNNFVPATDRLFINIQDEDDALIEFWVSKCLERIKHL